MEIKSSEKQVIRVLFLPSASVDGTNILPAEKELQEIKQRLSSNNAIEIIDRQVLKPEDALQAILNLKPNIVHFSAAGENHNGIFFKDDRGQAKLTPPEALASLFKLTTDHVKCVLIANCFSEKQATAISQYVPVVIGIKETTSIATVKFSTSFYTALNADLSYKSLAMAFHSSSLAIKFENLSEQSTPVMIEGALEIRFRAEVDAAFLSVSQPKGLAFEALKKGLSLTGKKMGVRDDIISKLLEEKIVKLDMHNNSVLEYERYLKDILRDEYPLSDMSNLALQKLQDGLDLTNEDAEVIKNKILNDPKLNSAESWYDRGRGQTELNNDEKAIEYFTKAIEKDGDYSAAYYERGYCYDRMGFFEPAVEDFTKAITFNNKWEVVSNLTLAYYSRARAYHAMRSADENKEIEYLHRSLDDWNKTLELNANQSEAYYGRGLVYEKLNMVKEAIADFSRSYEMSATEDRKRNSVIYLAKMYYLLGDNDEATKWMKLLKGENYSMLQESDIEKVNS